MSSSPTQVAGNAAPRVTNEEVRAVLHTHIRKTAKFIKFLDLCVYLFAWVAAMFGLWLMACVVDHWLVPLSSIGRWLVWTVAVVGTFWWLVTKLLPLVFRRINPAYAAKRIEYLLPEFKNGLISWLELDQMPENGVPRGIMSALTYRAARFIGGQDPSNTVDTSRLIKLIGVVLLLFTSLVLYTIVSPKSALDTGKRIAMPWSSIAAPSRVQILSVKPGAVELTQGKPLEVEVEVRGIRTNEPVQVRFTTTDGQLRDQRIELTAVTEGYRYSGKVRTETTGVEHELDYWIEAGDAISGPYRVSLSPLPSVVLDQVELKFPAYTKIPDRKVSGGDFEAVEGTRATIRALGNQKMSRGRLEIKPEVDAAGDLLRADAVHELSVDDRQLTGILLLKLNSEKENPTQLTYRLRGFNQRGDGNREPILHSMKVIADVGPEIKLVGPENRRQKVRPTSKFNLEVQANDPDFGLSRIDIEIRRSGLVVRKETLLKSDGAIGQQIKRLPINMADFKIPEGTKLEVRATAYDNRHDPDSEKLTPNSKESELLTLEVVGPDQEVAPDEEPAPTDPSADGKSEKNEEAGNNSSRSDTGAGNQSNNQGGADDRGASPNDPDSDPNRAEPSRDNSNPNDGSQEPRQNSTPNPANPNGSADQGEQKGEKQGKQEGANGKQEGKQEKQEGGQGKQGGQSSDGQSSDDKQKSGQAGGKQSGNGKQGSGQQQANDQGDQSGSQPSNKSGTQRGSKFGGNESSDGSKQPDAGSASSSKNSQANRSNAGKAGNEQSNSPSNSPSNSLGSKSNSPSPNGAKGNSGEKGSSGDKSNSEDSGANETGASGSGEGGKPSDAEAMKIVQDYIKEEKSKPSGNKSGGNESGGSEQSSDNLGSDSKGSNKQPGEKGATPKQNGSDREAQNAGTKNAGAKNEGTNPDPSGNEKSSKENSQSDNKGAQEKSSQDKDPNGKEDSDSNGDKNSESNSAGNKNSNSQKSEESQGKGSDGKGSDGKGSDGKGSDGKGSDGKGSDGKGSDGKGSDGKGSDGKGSDGKGSDGKGSDGKGSDGKGSDSKGSDGSDGKGSDPSDGADGKGADSKGADSKGADSKGADSKGADSKGADSKGSDSKGADSKGAGEQGGAQESKPSGGSEGGGKSNGSKSGKSGTSGTGTGNGEGGGDGKADAANEDYANRTTQMVLDYLNRQKDQPDPELLRELNWTEDDLRKFTERWNKARNLAVSPNPEDQKKWKEMLDDLGLNRQTVKPSAAGSIDDNFQQMRDSGNRTRPPENLRKQYEAFRRAFEKSGK